MRMKITVLTVVAILSGCAASRSNQDDFDLVASGAIPTERLASFSDCVTRSFGDKLVGLGMMIQNRQQQLEGLRRVEMFNADIGPMLSADIFDDGRYALYVTKFPSRFRVADERAAFEACAARYMKQ